MRCKPRNTWLTFCMIKDNVSHASPTVLPRRWLVESVLIIRLQGARSGIILILWRAIDGIVEEKCPIRVSLLHKSCSNLRTRAWFILRTRTFESITGYGRIPDITIELFAMSEEQMLKMTWYIQESGWYIEKRHPPCLIAELLDEYRNLQMHTTDPISTSHSYRWFNLQWDLPLMFDSLHEFVVQYLTHPEQQTVRNQIVCPIVGQITCASDLYSLVNIDLPSHNIPLRWI